MNKVLNKEQEAYIISSLKNFSTIKDIISTLNVEKKVIYRFLRKNNIKYELLGKRGFYNILVKNKEDIIETYNKTKTLESIRSKYGGSVRIIKKFLRDNGLTIRRKVKKYNFTSEELTDIVNLYNTGIPSTDISKKYNCDSLTIRDLLKKHNVIVKSSFDYPYKTEWMVKKEKSAFTHKPYTLPSGRIRKLQGYEPQFLDYVFRNNIYKEEDFDFSTRRIPYIFENKEHYYFPDFYIPKDNLIIEIKSDYILKRQGKDKNLAKISATERLGYTHLLVMDNNFESFASKISK
jgi:hypothetical protein